MKVLHATRYSLVAVLMAGTIGSAFAQQATSPNDLNPYSTKKLAHNRYQIDRPGAPGSRYRPLTVQRHYTAPGVADAVAAPVGVAGDIAGAGLGAGLGIVGGAVTGAATLATAPFAGLGGGAVGISPDPAPPLPVRARYAGTGPVAATVDQGWQQPVPLDKSGPIYELDKDFGTRGVTPISLISAPLTGIGSVIGAPLHAAY